MMTAARGLALVVANGRPVSNLSQDFTWLGGDVGRVPIPALVLVGLALVTSVVLNKLGLRDRTQLAIRFWKRPF